MPTSLTTHSFKVGTHPLNTLHYQERGYARSCNLTSDLFNSGPELGGLQPLSFLGSTSSASYACCATSAWRLLDIGGWLEQAKDNHLQSKSSSKLPPLCSTQPHIRGPSTNPSLLL